MSEQGRFGELLDKYECACREEGYASAFDKNCGDHYEARAAVVAHVERLAAENARLKASVNAVADHMCGALFRANGPIPRYIADQWHEQLLAVLEQPK